MNEWRSSVGYFLLHARYFLIFYLQVCTRYRWVASIIYCIHIIYASLARASLARRTSNDDCSWVTMALLNKCRSAIVHQGIHQSFSRSLIIYWFVLIIRIVIIRSLILCHLVSTTTSSLILRHIISAVNTTTLSALLHKGRVLLHLFLLLTLG